MAIAAVINRWLVRGAISRSAPVELLTGLIPAVAFRNIVLARRPLDPKTVTELVDKVPCRESAHEET